MNWVGEWFGSLLGGWFDAIVSLITSWSDAIEASVTVLIFAFRVTREVASMGVDVSVHETGLVGAADAASATADTILPGVTYDLLV